MALFLPCILTLALELPVFLLAGYRSRYDLTVVTCTNVITHLTLQLLFLVLPFNALWVILLELCVLAAEYGIYSVAYAPSKKLFLLTLAANALSLGVGLLLRMLLN